MLLFLPCASSSGGDSFPFLALVAILFVQAILLEYLGEIILNLCQQSLQQSLHYTPGIQIRVYTVN